MYRCGKTEDELYSWQSQLDPALTTTTDNKVMTDVVKDEFLTSVSGLINCIYVLNVKKGKLKGSEMWAIMQMTLVGK